MDDLIDYALGGFAILCVLWILIQHRRGHISDHVIYRKAEDTHKRNHPQQSSHQRQRPPRPKPHTLPPNHTHWHIVGELDDGAKFGQYGSLKYLLDELGRPRSPGFHEITPVAGGYRAYMGARTYVLTLNGAVQEAADERNRSY